MKDAYYFSHDANARGDPRIMAMLCVYGVEGYGRYWILVEKLREQRTYRLPINGEYSAMVYGHDLYCTPEEASKFVRDCIDEFHLFESDGTEFWSVSLIQRMERVEKKRELARVRQKVHRDNFDNITQMSRGKESIVKESIYVESNPEDRGPEAPSTDTKDGFSSEAVQRVIRENTTGTKQKCATDKDSMIRNLPDEVQSQFETFWKKYPAHRRVDKKRAIREWAKIGVTQEVFREIMDGLERHLACKQWKVDNVIPHISTWLHQERWKVELQHVKKTWDSF